MPLSPDSLLTVSDTHGQLLLEFRHFAPEHILCATWFGNLTGAEVIHGARQSMELQSHLHCPLLLNDKRQASGDWSEALVWLEYDWLPQASQAGLRAVAYVFSPDLRNHIASTEFVKRVQPHLPIQLFYNVPPAWSWLRHQPQA